MDSVTTIAPSSHDRANRKLKNAIATFSKFKSASALAHIHDVSVECGLAIDPEALVCHFDDDSLVELFAQSVFEKMRAAAAFDYSEKVAAAELERRLHERRKARGNDDSRIEIPHPRVEVVLEPEFSPYEIDVEQLREAVAALPENERAKLITITPAHTIPAQTIPERHVPESVKAGSIASIQSAARRFAGSAVGKVLERCYSRKRIRDRVIIRPRGSAK